MDELPSDEAFNNSNGIVDEEEATDNTNSTNVRVVKEMRTSAENMATNFKIAQEFLSTITKEKSSENYNFHWPKIVIKSVTSDGFSVPRMDFKPDQAPLCSTALSPSKERLFRVKVSSPSSSLNMQIKPLMRRKVIQKEIAFDRELKKLEFVWRNRGLPVDKETLHSAASKDAFDMSDLSDSLPSTSATEKKLSVLKNGRVQRCTAEWKKIFADTTSSVKDNIIIFGAHGWNVSTKSKFPLPQREMLHKPALDIRVERFFFEDDEKKEASGKNENPDMEKGIQNWVHKDQETILHHSMFPEFEKMSLDEKQERQNSVVENEEWCFPPLYKLSKNVILSSSWDSVNGCSSSDFETRDLRAPLNSPVKNEENAIKNERIQALYNKHKKLLEMRKRSLQLWHANCKLRTLNSQKDGCSEDMNDGSNTKKPSSEQVFVKKCFAAQKHVEALRAGHLNASRRMSNQMLIQLRESVKHLRIFPKHLSHSSVKYDKVVPD